jgi:hypothetical protein
MKYCFIAFALITFSCQRQKEFRYSFEELPMFQSLQAKLNLTDIKTTSSNGILVYMVSYKNDPNRIYAASSTGKELLYARNMNDDRNGVIGILRGNEAIMIRFTDGKREIVDITPKEYGVMFAKTHGGSGFCQREKGESFGACYKAESDEFCDSFVSCVALATQPGVAIVIGLACSCYAASSKYEAPTDKDTFELKKPDDTIINPAI